MYSDRIELYKKLEKEFNTKIITYVTSDRQNMSGQIATDVIDFFINHLDTIGVCKRISLILYTRGGDTSTARNIINLLRMYGDYLQVIVPHRAHSSGTIISLGADEIIMTKQATLGPIDPSLNTALNPISTLNNQICPVNVEDVKGYLEFAKKEISNNPDPIVIGEIFKKLTDYVHPLVLGGVYRSKSQIPMMAKKLLVNQVTDKEKIDKIIDFLCIESGSHDYTINRREAREELGLNVVNPTQDQYQIIKKIYEDIRDELELNVPFTYDINGQYSCKRALLESIDGGCDYFLTEGRVEKSVNPSNGIMSTRNILIFNGWRHGK